MEAWQRRSSSIAADALVSAKIASGRPS